MQRTQNQSPINTSGITIFNCHHFKLKFFIAYTRAREHTLSLSLSLSHTHALTHTHIHTHTHTHTHTKCLESVNVSLIPPAVPQFLQNSYESKAFAACAALCTQLLYRASHASCLSTVRSSLCVKTLLSQFRIILTCTRKTRSRGAGSDESNGVHIKLF